jgi:hypothetical protein
MKLDEIKTQWTAYDMELGNRWQLNLSLLAGWKKAESALQGLSRVVVVEMVAGLITVAVLAGFLVAHFQELPFFLPALGLHAFAIFQVASSGYQFVKLREIDFSAPILVSQKKLAVLRRLRTRVTMWTLILSPLLWVPLLIVLLKGLLGINAYESLDTPWLIANVLFGIAFIPVMIWASKHFSPRWQGSAFVKGLMDYIAGHELSDMNAFLARLEEYEQDESDA